MNFWLTTQAKSKIAAKSMLLTFAVIATIVNTAMPVFADTNDVPNNIVVYDNREKTLKITEISFTNDFTSMSVLVENIETKADFRIEHELNTEDTFNEHIEITATDGMGNVSETVNIKNPFYLPEIVETTPEPEPIKGSLSVTGGSDSGSDKEKETETESKPVSEGDKVTSESGGFSTNGWATVVDNADMGSKEFFVVRSETGNEFYVVIDRENGKDNVYFLNSVTEWDLLGLTQKFEVPNNLDPDSDLNNIVDKASTANDTDSGETKENSENQEVQPSTEPNENTPSEPAKQGGVGVFGIIILVLFAGAVGAYFYFFKFKRKNNNTNDADFLPDDYGEDYDGDEEDEGNSADDEDEENDDEDYEEEETPPPTAQTEPIMQSSETISKPTSENIDKDIVSADDAPFTDDDVGDTDYDENDAMDDYGEEVDENDVLGGLGGDEDEEDNTI